MADLVILCAALGTDPATVATGRYRGTGERSNRKGWRMATIYVREHFGRSQVTGAGPTDADAIEALVVQLRYRVTGRADRFRSRAAECRRGAADCRERANQYDEEAQRNDAEAARLEELARDHH